MLFLPLTQLLPLIGGASVSCNYFLVTPIIIRTYIMGICFDKINVYTCHHVILTLILIIICCFIIRYEKLNNSKEGT